MMKAGMERLGEVFVEIADEVGNFESVEAAEQTFDVVADLAVAVEREGLEAQRFGQRQQPVHPVFVAFGAHGGIAAPLEARSDGSHRDAAVTERNRVEDITL